MTSPPPRAERAVSRKPRILSGVQPTGSLHLGNYLGALTLWAQTLDDHDCFFCVVDLHALTIPEAVDPAELREKSRQVAALYIASGIDPDRANIFVQSDVAAHSEMMWILNCVTPLGWLQRMTQFKSKSGAVESVGTGLLTYPVLQAADILLYEANLVPVGEDQKQHVELARDVAQRFNHLFGETLVVPELRIRESGARVMAFDDPEQKMSKSRAAVSKGHAVGLLDSEKDIRRAILRATTDSGQVISFEDGSPGIRNLLTIYQVLTGESREAIEAHFADKMYGHLKKEVADLVVDELMPVQERYREITADPSTLDVILDRGADRAREVADRVVARAQERVGLRASHRAHQR